MTDEPQPQPAASQPSGAKAFREELRAFIDTHSDVPAPLLASMFAAQLKETTLREWAASEAQTMIVIETRAQFARDRHSIFRIKNWEVYREYVPGHGHRPLLKLNRLEVRAALGYRMRTVIGNVVPAELLRRLDVKMKTDKELVEDRFSTDELTVLARTIRKEIHSGSFRLAIKSTPSLPGRDHVSRQDIRGRSAGPQTR